MTIGEKIKAARKQKGWTQTKLADKLGVSPEAVSKWERGAYLPEVYNEERLNDLLGLDLIEDDGRPVNGRLFNDDHIRCSRAIRTAPCITHGPMVSKCIFSKYWMQGNIHI